MGAAAKTRTIGGRGGREENRVPAHLEHCECAFFVVYAEPESYKVEEIHFTKAQLNVLTQLAQGKSVNEVAKALYLSKHTIETHRKHMLSKTKFNDTNELINFALEAGLV